MNGIKQIFLGLVKSIKDEEYHVNNRGRLFSWEELQNDLQLSISQRINELTIGSMKNLPVIYQKKKPFSA
jgi:hypothetical protein